MPQSKDKSTDFSSSSKTFAYPQKVQLLKEKHWSFVQKKYQLTPREMQVAKLICQGLTYAEIAKELKIKTGTVKTHLRNNYRKIHVNTKIQMLLQFINDVAHILSRDGSTPLAITPVTTPLSSDTDKVTLQQKD